MLIVIFCLFHDGHIILRRIMWGSVKSEVEWVWKEDIMAKSEVTSRIFWERLNNI